MANVIFEVPINEVTTEVKTEIEDLVADADIDGVALYPSQEIAQTVPSILGPGEIAGVVIAAIVLFVMLGTVHRRRPAARSPRCWEWPSRRSLHCPSRGWSSSSPSPRCSA